MKTPGVCINEKNAFPNSVGVDTSVPVFFRVYTEETKFKGKPLKTNPPKINIML